jgi:RimJ/RimL family protein N-acetyltransferase
MRYLNGGIPTPSEVITHNILPNFLKSYARGDGYGVWAAEERTTSEFVGWFSFHPTDDTRPGDVALGYRLRRSAWGKGYATEGARALIRQGFTEQGTQRVIATTYQDNLASRRVLEKAGLRLTRRYHLTLGDLAAETDTFVPGNKIWDGDDMEYTLTRAEWERQALTERSVR